MKANTYDYFLNLDKQKLNRENGVIMVDDRSLDNLCYTTIKLEDREYFAKYGFDAADNLQQIATCNLFHNSGLLTPPIFLCSPPSDDDRRIYQLSEDVHRTKFIKCLQPHKMDEYKMFYEDFTPNMNNTWEILYNKNLREYFLTFMTEECFAQLMSLFAVDTLRTEQDRHFCNYFLYKLPGSDKYNGVIAIDHDATNIVELNSNFYLTNSEEFNNNFLKYGFSSRSPIGVDIYTSHEENIKNLKNVIDKGLMPVAAIFPIKDALNFNFNEAVKNVGKKYHCSDKDINNIYDPISCLWEYNRKELADYLDL